MEKITIILIVLIVLVCLLSLLASKDVDLSAWGGRESPRRFPRRTLETPQNIVIDTLNLTHWLDFDLRDKSVKSVKSRKITLCDIIDTIDTTAPLLRKQFPGRIVYVTKTRETEVTPEENARMRAIYQEAAKRNKVYIDVVERLPRTAGSPPDPGPHAALGRDDFYLIVSAHKLHAGVLSRDRFRDLPEMKSGVLKSFHVYKYSPFKAYPERDFVNPAAAEFKRLRRPRLFLPEDYLSDLQSKSKSRRARTPQGIEN